MYRFFLILFLPVVLFAQSHLLITEVFIPPTSEANKAFVEIANETSHPIKLGQRYLANYNTYYQIVANQYPATASFFLARFPSSATMQPGDVKVIALDGAGYFNAFGKSADFEIKGTDDQTPDMDVVKMGGNPILETIKGMMILFRWDGQSDLVKDVDYIPWGLTVFNSVWMDKSGVQIDGPDNDTLKTAYANDLPKIQQKAINNIPTGKSLQRNGVDEIDEVSVGGNGITGHDEATENWRQSFKTAAPIPGSFSAIPGDGTGTVTIAPDTVDVKQSQDFILSFSTSDEYELTKIQIDVPQQFTWSQQASDVILQGAAFSAAQITVNKDTITIQSAALNQQQSGTVTIKSVKVSSTEGKYVFQLETATQNGNLTPIAIFPSVLVIKKLTIADIQNNVSEYNGKQVTIDAVVTIGVNVLRNDRTSVYVQDESGRGINLNDKSTNHPELVRGNRLRIKGTVSEYKNKYEDVTTQIEKFNVTILSTNNPVPAVQKMNCASASNIKLEGTFVETVGIIRDKAEGVGGGTNITIDDGSGTLELRIWDTAGLDLSGFNVGDPIQARGVIGSYKLVPQLLVCYQQDITSLEQEEGLVTLKVPNKPFAPDEGEKLPIEYSAGTVHSHVTLRLFDLNGRMVTTLFDGTGLPFPITKEWDGRDQLGELVGLGTYICHLEVVNNNTGKRTVKIAPIVVGTILK